MFVAYGRRLFHSNAGRSSGSGTRASPISLKFSSEDCCVSTDRFNTSLMACFQSSCDTTRTDSEMLEADNSLMKFSKSSCKPVICARIPFRSPPWRFSRMMKSIPFSLRYEMTLVLENAESSVSVSKLQCFSACSISSFTRSSGFISGV